MACLNSCLPASIRAQCSVLKSLNLFCWLQMDFSLVPINFFWGFGLWGPWASIQPSYFWPVHPAVPPAKSIFLGVVRVFVQVLEVLNFYSIYFNYLWKLGIALVLHWRDFFFFFFVCGCTLKVHVQVRWGWMLLVFKLSAAVWVGQEGERCSSLDFW